jgi:sortase A
MKEGTRVAMKKSRKAALKDNRRRAIRILGFLLIAVAVGTIGYAVYNIINTETGTAESLKEAEQMISDMKNLGPAGDWSDEDLVSEDYDGEDYTLPADESSPPDQPADTNQATDPQVTPGTSPSVSASPGKPTKKGPVMGVLVLESLGGRRVAVINGASASDLNRGAGHHPRTSLPGRTGNCLIFGHRNTVFSGFGSLRTGDLVRFEGPKTSYTYKITEMKIIDPDNPAIFAMYDKPMMTLVTCYPFNYVGSAPRRYMVLCSLVE